MKLNKESLSDQIGEEIRKRIINVEIDQGEKINVTELEDEFDVSRAPVREALQSLVDEGLVEVKPRVGYFAVELSPNQVKDISEMRRLLEEHALKKSINRMPREKIEKIKDQSLELKRNDYQNDVLRKIFDETDEKLHSMIIEYSKNEFLKQFAGRIHNLVALTRHLNERMEAALEEHIDLLRAILNKDKEKAVSKLEVHLNNVEEEIIENY